MAFLICVSFNPLIPDDVYIRHIQYCMYAKSMYSVPHFAKNKTKSPIKHNNDNDNNNNNNGNNQPIFFNTSVPLDNNFIENYRNDDLETKKSDFEEKFTVEQF